MFSNIARGNFTVTFNAPAINQLVELDPGSWPTQRGTFVAPYSRSLDKYL
jgi:hypothetical protein